MRPSPTLAPPVGRTALRSAAIALALALSACAAAPPPGPAPLGRDAREPLRVLFIGNSLTYTNDLPAVAAAMARATGQQRPPAFVTVALPNFSLEDHWRDGRARSRLRRGRWDVVVLQQGPSSLPANRELLRRWSARFAVPIRGAGARPALLTVWPAAARAGDFPGVAAAYAGAAAAVDGLLLPAGEAWRAALARDPGLPLYGPDGFHPSPAGTWLAALVVFCRLYDVAPGAVPAELELADGTRLRLDPAIAESLRRAAGSELAATPPG